MKSFQIDRIVRALAEAGVVTEAAKAAEVLKEAFKDEIHIVWSVDDVQTINSKLTDEEARDVLEEIERSHDCEQGITWDTIREFTDSDEDEEDDEEDEEEGGYDADPCDEDEEEWDDEEDEDEDDE